MKLIVDLMGADKGVEEIVLGVIESLNFTKSDFILCGPKDIALDILKSKNIDLSRFEFIDTQEFISNDDDPARSIRRKKDSSLVLGLNRLNLEENAGFISAGSTGALLAGGLFVTKRINNVERAILVSIAPTKTGRKTMLADTGAMMDSKPNMLEQYALMASIYSKKFLDIKSPEIMLLNVGVEEGKGDLRSKETFDLLKNNPKLNFKGNIEARDFLLGVTDIIVSDGFSGNVMLKSHEGAAQLLLDEIKEGIYSKLKYKLAGLILKPVFKKLSKKFDYKEVGSAILLGVKKPLFKAHGSSDRIAIKNAVINAEKFVEKNIIKDLEEEFNG